MKHIVFSFLLIICADLKSQHDFYNFNILAGAAYTTDKVPYWMQANQFGSIPPAGPSISLTGMARKIYNPVHSSLLDWGGGLEFRGNIGNTSNVKLIEGYAKVRIGVFELRGGRSRISMGLCDTLLSTGSFAISGNAPGIPRIEIGIPDFYTLPIMGSLFAFKGNYAHGWIGSVPVKMPDNAPVQKLRTYFHQKSLYGRFGRPGWKLKLYGGFNHQAFWGSEDQYFGSYHILTPFETYMYVITGKRYGTDDIPSSKIGNQLGSIDVGFDYRFKKVKLYAYHQFFYDAGALYHLANLRDGLNGLAITNTASSPDNFEWNKILIEVLYSKNQAGELWSPYTPSGDENYYNNYQYLQGWSYKSFGIGNPLLSQGNSIRDDLPSDPGDYFINNRVIAFHAALKATLFDFNLTLKTSYSLNYGTYGTSEAGHSVGKNRRPPQDELFDEQKQFSAFFEVGKVLNNKFILNISTAFDKGKLLYDSAGLMFTVGYNL